MKASSDPIVGGPTAGGPDPIQDYIQPDTEIEPSIAVNPKNPKNVVAVFQDRRIADGGDATNGFATSLDGGKTWTTGTLPGLTTYPGQGGVFERASDAVVAFGPDGTVYANSLVFDYNTNNGLRSGLTMNVSKDGGRHWSPPVYLVDDMIGGLNDKNWIVVDQSDAPGHHKGRVYVVWDRVAPVLYDYCDHDCDKLANWLPDFQTIPAVAFAGQGIGAYPVIQKDGGLGIVMDALSGGVPVPSGPDELEVSPGTDQLVYLAAPAAGTTPWPAPLAFLPPVKIATNMSIGTPAQRGERRPAVGGRRSRRRARSTRPGTTVGIAPTARTTPCSAARSTTGCTGRFRSESIPARRSTTSTTTASESRSATAAACTCRTGSATSRATARSTRR